MATGGGGGGGGAVGKTTRATGVATGVSRSAAILRHAREPVDVMRGGGGIELRHGG